MQTVRGFDFFECSSTMQKAIRRADTAMAGYFALELVASGYAKYVWKRLLTVSAEDCWGILTHEVEALFNGWKLVNEGKKRGENEKGRIFICKAVVLLCSAKKSRDADHLSNIVYDRGIGVNEEDLIRELANAGEYIDIPEYAFDCHTKKGRQQGATKSDFFHAEQAGLKPLEPGLFDDLIDEGFPVGQSPAPKITGKVGPSAFNH